jgi:hypothetical protein
VLVAATPAKVNVTITLSEPVVVATWLGRRRAVRVIALAVDDPAELRRAVQEHVARISDGEPR